MGSKSPLRYAVVVFPDGDGGGFCATVPDLPGCFVRGDSQGAVLDTIGDAIAHHLAALDAEDQRAPAAEPLSDHWRQDEYQWGEWFFVNVAYRGKVRRA
ncbi:MAG: type II toxin-antitoxin system HicB family antitoxin [Candidatus Competibacterales bacterium]